MHNSINNKRRTGAQLKTIDKMHASETVFPTSDASLHNRWYAKMINLPSQRLLNPAT